MVQVPTLMAVTVLPLTEQILGVNELKVTGRPDEEVSVLAVTVPPTANVVGLKVIGFGVIV